VTLHVSLALKEEEADVASSLSTTPNESPSIFQQQQQQEQCLMDGIDDKGNSRGQLFHEATLLLTDAHTDTCSYADLFARKKSQITIIV
jgi:hypothetical protein